MKTAAVAALASLLTLLPVSAEPGDGRATVRTINTNSDAGGWLGVSIQDMTPRLAESMNVETRQGALVNEVVDESPAMTAGIREEDIIIEFDGHSITNAEDLVSRVCDRKPGEEISLVLMRGNERQSLLVTLAKPNRPRAFSFGPTPRFDHGMHVFLNHSTLGMEVQDLSGQLSEYFGAPKNEGVLVTGVDDESAARKAGLKAGDVILKVGSQTIRESDDIWDEVEEYEKGEKVDVEILRERSRKTVTIEIEEASGMHWFRGPESKMHFEFDHDFDHESLRHLEDDLRWEQDRSDEEIDRLRIHLKEIGEKIREWGYYLKEKFEGFSLTDS